jgi:hypothetical protein
MQDGFIFIWINTVMRKLFGVNWRTTFWGLVALITGSSTAIIQFMTEYVPNKKYIVGAGLAMTILANFVRDTQGKDKQVTGTVAQNEGTTTPASK